LLKLKKYIKRWLEYLGDRAPLLAAGVLLATWPFPRLYLFVARHARLNRRVMERTFYIQQGPLAGFRLRNLLSDEIGPILTHKMEIICSTVLMQLPLESGVVLDIGGLYGYYALLLARLVGADGRVFSFEPDWHSFSRLAHNLALNDIQNVIPVPLCVSDVSGGLAKWCSVGDKPWESGLVENVQAAGAHALTSVPITTLDDFGSMLEIAEDVKLIKIDVEGAELKVLQGATQLLRKSKPIILCELHGAGIAQQVFSFLSELDYHWEQLEYADETRQHILAFVSDQAEMCRAFIKYQQDTHNIDTALLL